MLSLTQDKIEGRKANWHIFYDFFRSHLLQLFMFTGSSGLTSFMFQEVLSSSRQGRQDERPWERVMRGASCHSFRTLRDHHPHNRTLRDNHPNGDLPTTWVVWWNSQTAYRYICLISKAVEVYSHGHLSIAHTHGCYWTFFSSLSSTLFPGPLIFPKMRPWEQDGLS